MNQIHKTNIRRYHADQSFSDILTVKLPRRGLRFIDIEQSNRQHKLREIAHFCYFRAWIRGDDRPLIVSYARLEQDRPVAELFPGQDDFTASGERLLSANSFLTATLREAFAQGQVKYGQGECLPTSKASVRTRAALAWLNKNDRFYLYTGPDSPPPATIDFTDYSFDVARNFVPVDRCGTLGDYVGRYSPRLAFNTAFFLLEREDYFSHHSGLGEAFNLWVSKGEIRRPPLYRRGAIFGDAEGHWQTGFFSLEDVVLTLPTDIKLYPHHQPLPTAAHPFAVNAPGQAEITLYTRYWGVNEREQVLGYTPHAPNTLELTVIDRRLVGWKIGGDLAIPQNGFVISFAPGVLSAAAQQRLLAALTHDFRLSYTFLRPEHQAIQEALQTGPLLVRQGRPWLLNRDVEQDEQFWPSRTLADGSYCLGLVPTDYDREGLHHRHARTALGITRQGKLILVMVAGVSKGAGITAIDSQGASLLELADLLMEAGAQEAVNFDGGGSAQAYYYGGRALIPGERRGLPQVHFERPIPSIGVFS